MRNYKELKIRRLLICSSPRNDIEIVLQRMYLRRIQEMFKKAITIESTFNIFDEVFHGITQTASINENLYSFYEAFLTITQYYQHSQAGRGSLIAKLLKELGISEKMEFEFVLKDLPQFLGQRASLEETVLTKQKFDIATKNEDNIVLCELKMRVYSGCSAGRIELMEKFNKFVEFLIGNKKFRNVFKNGGIKHIYLLGGILFDIEGNPATIQKDKDWEICYSGLIRAKDDMIRRLKNKGITCSEDKEKLPEKAFSVGFSIDGINVKIIAVYGNEVIRNLFIGKQTRDIFYFKQQLKEMLYDDLWLGQIITLSERAILNQNFKRNKKLDNFITAIIKNNLIVSEIERFRNNRNENVLEDVACRVINSLETSNSELLKINLIPAFLIMKSSDEKYLLKDYIADIIQFLSCENVIRGLI